MRFLERQAEFFGISVAEIARRILSDVEKQYRQSLIEEREREWENL